MKRWVKYYLPSFLWAVLIFVGSSITPLFAIEPPFIDKLFHLIEFAIFGFLVARSFDNAETSAIKSRFIIFSIIICALYGLSDEIHQLFVPMRGFEILDLLADSLGGILGTAIYTRLTHYHR